MIAASALSYRIGQAQLVREVGLEAQAGECIAIVGPNGAGKSTLLRLLSGELRPHSGTVRLDGRDLSSYVPRELALRRAVLPQSVAVAFPFTVAEIVRMAAPEVPRRRLDDMVEAALGKVDLAGHRDRIITTLSGGEQKRAHLARVLVQLAHSEAACGPGVLLLDEPTDSLDLHHQIETIAMAKERARQGTTVLAVLHDLNLAAMLAGRIVVVDGGTVAADGSPEAVLTEALLRDVFRIAAPIGVAPEGVPFVLPQTMRVHDRATGSNAAPGISA